MSKIMFAIKTDPLTNRVAKMIFEKLPTRERRHIESSIAAVTEGALPTLRPFMFGGKAIHELYVNPVRLHYFLGHEKIGLIVSAFIIASLAGETEGRIKGCVPLSDLALIDQGALILRHAKRWKYEREVSAFLRRFNALADDWSRSACG